MTPVGAGDVIAASTINDLITALTPVEVTTTATVGSVASGYTVNDVRATTLAAGKLVVLELYLINTAAITATTSNINPDITVFTLTSAYYPSHAVSFVWGNGAVSGEGTISTAGVVSLRSASDSAAAASNIRISATYIRN